MSLPNAFIIGVQKAGTTSLHNWISQHPDIYGPGQYKDVDYFANPKVAPRAEKRLNKDYSGHSNESVILQSQANYIFYPPAIRRISQLISKAKLVAIFRDPADRAISAYRYFKKMGREHRGAKEALLYEPVYPVEYSKNNSDFTYLEHGMYGKQLEAVLEYFDRDNILILDFEELKNDPKQLTQKVFNFLDVDASFEPEFKKKNQTGKVRFEWLHSRLTNTTPLRQFFIKYFLDWWMPVKKRQLLRKKMIDYNTQARQSESDKRFTKVKGQLQSIFEEDQNTFKELINHI